MPLGRDSRFTWYGQSCFEVTTPGGKTVIIDPFFANPRSPRTADSIDRSSLVAQCRRYQERALAYGFAGVWQRPALVRGAECKK